MPHQAPGRIQLCAKPSSPRTCLELTCDQGFFFLLGKGEKRTFYPRLQKDRLIADWVRARARGSAALARCNWSVSPSVQRGKETDYNIQFFNHLPRKYAAWFKRSFLSEGKIVFLSQTANCRLWGNESQVSYSWRTERFWQIQSKCVKLEIIWILKVIGRAETFQKFVVIFYFFCICVVQIRRYFAYINLHNASILEFHRRGELLNTQKSCHVG